MAERLKIASGSKWEDIVGYSRAIRVGNIIEIAGTTSMDGEILIGENDVHIQTQFIFKKIEKILHGCNSSLKDIVRTRMFVTDITKWEEIAKAHNEFFAVIKPVATMVEVKRLINEKLLIEIEVSAICC